jgi:hypothetical protein
MQIRHALLGLALVVAGLATGGAHVLAQEDGEHRQELHRVRRHDPAVIDRTRTLRRLEHALDAVDEIAALTPAYPAHAGRGHGPRSWRHLRDDAGESPADVADEGREELHERRGAEPVERGELHRRPHHGTGPAIEERLDDLRHELLRLRREVIHAPEVLPAPIVLHPMATHAFRGFVRDIRREPFADGKVAVIRDVVRHAHLTSAQAEIVVRAVQSWGQVDAAVALYPRVLDKESFHVVVSALTFDSDRDDLRRRIRRLH